MNKLMTTFDYFLTTSTPKMYLMQFVINLIIAALLAHFLKKIYIRYGKAVSNRARFASNFFLMVTTTMLIISIVKSSLALSLGLVGALSIVRFRTAIKEPEELAVLFFAISLGLGLGAGQRMVTIVGFVVIAGMWVYTRDKNEIDDNHMLLQIENNKGKEKISISAITDTLCKYCTEVKVKRIDDLEEELKVSLLVTIASVADIENIVIALKAQNKGIAVSYVDNIGII